MLKVLVVEDEELIRKGIVLAVDWAALDCVVVGEASNAVERLSPSLIITDLKMPRMDGIEMLRRLREAGNPVYVIILTAYDSFTYAQSALRLGAVDFLLKPFHDGELEQAVTNLQRRMAEGTTFARALAESGLLPPAYTSMIAAGTKTGRVDEMMDLTARRLSEDIDLRLERRISLVEPAVVIIMCILIGAVLLSVMLPLIRMMTSF